MTTKVFQPLTICPFSRSDGLRGGHSLAYHRRNLPGTQERGYGTRPLTHCFSPFLAHHMYKSQGVYPILCAILLSHVAEVRSNQPCNLEISVRRAIHLAGDEAEVLLKSLPPPEGWPAIGLPRGSRIESKLENPNEVEAYRGIAAVLYEKLRQEELETSDPCLYELLFFLYERFKEEDLDEVSRLRRGCVSLRVALLSRTPSNYAFATEPFLEETFKDFDSTLGARNEVQRLGAVSKQAGSAESANSTRQEASLRGQYGIAKADLEEVSTYVEDFVGAVSWLARTYPDLGYSLGRWLKPVLTNATSVFEKHPYQTVLQEYRQWLIDFDGGSLSGPGHFDLANRLVKGSLRPIDLGNHFRQLMEQQEKIETLLTRGVDALNDPSQSWMPFKRYSDDLYDLYEDSQERSLGMAVEKRLVEQSCRALYEGIRIHLRKEQRPNELQLVGPRRELYSRVYARIGQLHQRGLYQESICFTLEFLASPQVFERKDSERIHGQIAISYYLLGVDRKAMDHLDKSGGSMTFDQLQTLRERWGRFITQRGIGLCQTPNLHPAR